AEPADEVPRLAVLVVDRAAAPAQRLPAPVGHVGVEAQPFRPGADFGALCLPLRVMAVAGADECVRDLVQQRVPDQLLTVPRDEVDRQLNGLPAEEAQA